MAKVALVPVPTAPHRLVLVAGLYLALVVGVGAVVTKPALPWMNFLQTPFVISSLWLSRSLASPAKLTVPRAKCVDVS